MPMTVIPIQEDKGIIYYVQLLVITDFFCRRKANELQTIAAEYVEGGDGLLFSKLK